MNAAITMVRGMGRHADAAGLERGTHRPYRWTAAVSLGAVSLDQEEIVARLAQLRQEYRDLDTAIATMEGTAMRDQLVLVRTKKRKLRLRDEIAQLEDQLIPDIIA